MRLCLLRAASVVLLFFYSSQPAPGQAVNATLLGTVTDTTGAAVGGAKVTILEVNTSVTRTAVTNDSGNYTFPTLTPGTYDVTIEKDGFRKAVRRAVEVLVNTTVRVDMQIQPGTISEEITVTAEVPLLQTDRTDTGRKLEARQLVELPISYNHNVQGLLNLVPGTTRAERPHSEFFNPQDSLATRVNGNSRLANNLQLEGIDDNERTGLLQVYIPPAQALSTMDVTTSNYEAELGRAGGAVTNLVLKSGTNSFHGQAYAFNQVSALQAVNFFDHVPGFRKPVTVYNYDGFNLGGPIVKKKLFFFGDYVHISDHRGKTDRYDLPTAALRAGDFGGTGTTIYDPYQTTDATHQTLVRDANGNPIPVAQASRTPFPNNMIPDARIDPISKKILGFVPLPNIVGREASFTQNFIETFKFIKTTHSFDTKIDCNPNEQNHISGRLSFQKFNIFDPSAFGDAGGPHSGGFQGSGTQKTWVPGVNWDHIFSTKLIMELRVGVERYRNDARQVDYGKNDATAIGIPGANTADPFTSGLTSVDITNFSNPLVGYSASLPWVRSETNIDLMNHWTKTKGNHTVKWGADIRRIRDDLLQTQTFNPRGTFRFRTGQTSLSGAKDNFANAFASFLLDVPFEVGRDLPVVFPTYRQWWLFFYGSDKWQISPKLTLDAGLRWDLYPPATPRLPGTFSNYDPSTNNLVVAGVGGNPMNLGMDFRKTNFGPRMGLAYRFTEKTVVRAGFGISYEPFPDNTYAFNYPVKQNNVFTGVTSSSVALLSDNITPATFANGFPAPLVASIPANGIIPANTPLLINQTYFVIPKNFKNPYIEAWNLAVQRALPHDFTLDMAYVGNHGVDIATVYNLNAVNSAALAGLNLGDAARPQWNQLDPITGLPLHRKANTETRFIGTSNSYHALQVKFDHRSANFLLTTSYTYSKSLGITDEDGGFMWYINPRRSYARAGWDRTHTFVQSYTYNLPFGKGRPWLTSGFANRILGGWEIGGILTLMTGTPMNFTASDSSLNTKGNAQTANINGAFRRLYGVGKDALWFDTSLPGTSCQSSGVGCVFTQPTGAGVFGNTGRHIFSGPGFFNLDLSAFKRIQLTERFNLQFRSDWFSATNTPQFNNPNTSLTSSDFGHVRGAGGARAIDFGLTLSF